MVHPLKMVCDKGFGWKISDLGTHSNPNSKSHGNLSTFFWSGVYFVGQTK